MNYAPPWNNVAALDVSIRGLRKGAEFGGLYPKSLLGKPI